MKRRAVTVAVSDHAVLRWLERAHGLDIEALRHYLAGKAQMAAELKAQSVVTDGVRLVLREQPPENASAPAAVVVVTVLERGQRRGLGSAANDPLK